MHFIKKTTTIGLLTIMVLLQCVLASTAMAEDYQTHSSSQAIQEGVDQGLIELSDGNFYPDEAITRQEWVRLLIQYLGYFRLSADGFEDVASDSSYYEDFLIAKEAGLVTGDEDNMVYPNEQITREEALNTVVLALRGRVTEEPVLLIQDGDKLNTSYEPQVRYAVSAGWFPLNTNNELEPQKEVSRAQAVTLLDIATGTRLMDETSFGNALETTQVEENISVYSPETLIQRITGTKDIYVLPSAGTKLTLNKVQLDGKLVVLGVGDMSIELKNSRIALLETRNPYGTVEVVRDSKSSIGNFLQGTPLNLVVQEEKIDNQPSSTPPEVFWFSIGFVCFLIGMIIYQSKDRTRTVFISQGVGKYVYVEQAETWEKIGVVNPQPQIVDVYERKGKVRIEGLEEGRAHVELYQIKDDEQNKQLDGVEHAHLKKSRKGRAFLNIVVVKGKEQ
ncbi:S-layer homology domain-containing protein [Clostridia bacterium]|nr:S-layer homology domain-containing protein [Clostridia bacterium]